MRLLLPLIGIALAVSPAWSHPGPGIAVNGSGQVYFVDGVRHRVMRVDADGKLATFVQGEDGKTLSVPHHLAMDDVGNLYSVGDRDSVVWKISPEAKLTKVYPPAGSKGKAVIGSGGDPFTRDAKGNLYGVAGEQFRRAEIIKISLDGRATVLAGGAWGHADGRGVRARFGDLHSAGFAWNADGALLVTDSGSSVRQIAPDGTVTTLAGRQTRGFADGPAADARFDGACGLAVDEAGNVLVADTGNRRIRKITKGGQVSALPSMALFDEPAGVAVGQDGAVYVLDYARDNPRVRRLKSDGAVTTIAEIR
jgi:DNA-binding beta-propeller fold protein YncE